MHADPTLESDYDSVYPGGAVVRIRSTSTELNNFASAFKLDLILKACRASP